MKVIDLLNKIAKGEEVPKKIIVEGIKYSIVNEGYSHTYKDINGYEIEDNHSKYIIDSLNDEVEIIEEDKEITKWEGALEEIKTKTDYKIKDLQKYIKVLMETQNDIIDELNKLKGKSE